MTTSKGGLNLATLFAKPIATLETSQGTIYVHLPDGNVQQLHRDLVADAAEDRAGKTLALMASQVARTSMKEEIKPLPENVLKALDQAEISQIAELFRKTVERRLLSLKAPSSEIEPQKEGESALAFFDRVLDVDIKEYDEQSQRLRQQILDTLKMPASTLLEQLHGSSDRLQGTIRAYESLATPMPAVMRDYPGEAAREAATERQKDREIARLTADMTKQSAEMLRDLVDTAGKFLLRFDERDRISDKQIKNQLWVALGSLAVSVVLSGVGVWYARAAYVQDGNKNAVDAVSGKEAGELAASSAKRFEELLTAQAKALEEQTRALQALQEQKKMIDVRQADSQPAKKAQP